MDGRMATAVAILVLTASAVAAVPVGGTPSNEPGGFGASISAFMQSSAAQTEGSVENGMWSAQFNSSDTERREQLVESRSAALVRKVNRLQSERFELLNGSDGGVSAQERAKAARLAARIESLNEAINDTQRAAEVVGVNVTRLNELRSNARTLNGSEISEMARGLAGKKKTATESDGLIDIPGLGDDGPPGQDKKNNSSNGDAPGKSNRGNNSSGNPGAGSGNSDRGRSGNPGDADGPQTPGPENNTSNPPQNETAAREGGQRETDRRNEKNGSDRRRKNGRKGNVTAGSGSNQRNQNDGVSSPNRSGRSGDSENASSSGGGSENRSGNVSS